MPPSILSCKRNRTNIIVTAMKKAEDENAVVLRFYEWAGKDGDVTLQLPPGAQSAEETDLMEKPIGSASLQNGRVTLHTKPYEIKTIKVQFSNLPQVCIRAQTMTATSTTGSPVLGVDIGGTKVAVGLVDSDGKIVAQVRQPMVASGTAEAALHAVTAAIDSLTSSGIDGVRASASAPPGLWIPGQESSLIRPIFPAGEIFRWRKKSPPSIEFP